MNQGIVVSSIYGLFNKKPYVQVEMFLKGALTGKIQMRPDEARMIAHQLIECAEASEQDAWLMQWGRTFMQEEGDTEEELDKRCAELLQEFRTWREENPSG